MLKGLTQKLQKYIEIVEFTEISNIHDVNALSAKIFNDDINNNKSNHTNLFIETSKLCILAPIRKSRLTL